MDPEDHLRINVFDWSGKDGFPEIMKSGGFDAVIGNPPYGAYLFDGDKAYLIARYPHQTYQLDTYLLFLEQTIRLLLRDHGLFGMIIPNPWLTNLKQDKLRRLVLGSVAVKEIVHFKFSVFPKVVVNTEIVLLEKCSPDDRQVLVSSVASIDSFIAGPDSSGYQLIMHQQSKWQATNGAPINSLVAALDTQQFLCLNNMHVLVPRDEADLPHFLLGVINSQLMNWFYRSMNPEVGEALAEVKKTNVALLPIRVIDPHNHADQTVHDRIVSLVETMLAPHRQQTAARTPHEQTALDRQISATDRQIDRLVYDLYGLTEEEIALVEGA